MAPPDEDALIGQAQRGDVAAFEELVRRHDRNVLRLALSLLGSEEEARDVYQDAFLKVFRSLRGFRRKSSLETWIYRIVTNLCLDRLRRPSARREARAGAGPAEGALDRLALLPDDRPGHDPERTLQGREVRRRIEAALAGLAPRERLVFELRHDQGLRLKRIAEILETTEETARNCLFRAHRELRARLRDLRGEDRGAEPGRAAAGEVEP